VDRSLFRGRYLRGHLVVLTLAGLFVLAGKWQLDRLHQLERRNEIVRARMAAEPVPIDEVLRPVSRAEAVDAGEATLRRVVVTGRWNPKAVALVRFRSYSGDPGYYLLGELVTPKGSVLVNRGWVPLSQDPAREAMSLVPAGTDARITGIVLPSESGASHATAQGGVTEVSRINLRDPRLFALIAPSGYPAYVQLTAQEPAQQGDYPLLLPAPELTNGPHLSYAIQWFSFAMIALIGWPLLAGRSLRKGSPSRRTP
jgi:cytochrome oxidase assembly protein ShyY1